MEEVWNSLRTSENYSISNIEQSDESDDDDIKIVCISDTHGRHADMNIPTGDVLVHAGDFTMFGLVSEIINFNQWLATLPHKHKIVVGGNHELSLDERTMDECREYMEQVGEMEHMNKNVSDVRSVLSECLYLQDQS